MPNWLSSDIGWTYKIDIYVLFQILKKWRNIYLRNIELKLAKKGEQEYSTLCGASWLAFNAKSKEIIPMLLVIHISAPF